MPFARLLRPLRLGRGMTGIGLAAALTVAASGQVSTVAPYPSLGMSSMALANNRIYYTTGVFAQEFCTAYKQVFSLSTTGTPGAALLDSTAPGGCAEQWTNLIPQGAFIYMAMGHGVQRVFALGGQPTETVVPTTTITPVSFAVDQFRVYVESPDDVLTAYPNDGGAPVGTVNVPGLVGFSAQNFTAPGDGFVYFIANGNIFKWNGTSGTTIPLETSTTVANVIWVDATDVWWVGSLGGVQTIGKIPVGGGANSVRHTTPAGTDVYAMIGDANNIYFMADPPGGGLDVIRRLPRNSTVATDVNDISNNQRILCQDEQFLYWSEFGGASPGIKRNFKNATIARPDLFWGQDRIEVIQAVQDNVNSVQLVAGRPAMARVYPQATQLIKGVVASLEGTTTSGVPLPGSPIRPVSFGTDCNTTLPDRGSFNKSFNFIIPDSWVAAGAGSTTNIRLRATIDPINYIAESNEGNNTTSLQTFTFRKTPTLVLDCRRVLTHGGDYTMGDANFGEIILRAGSMIPYSKVTVRECGGRLEEWEPTLFHPDRHGPWELNGKHWECAWLCNEDDFVLVKLGLEWLGSEISSLFGESVVNHRLGMVHGNDDWGWGGLAPPLPPVLLVKMSGPENFNQVDNPYGGNALAHELTHNWGYQHVNCGTGFRGGFDDDYPYDPCAMGHSDTDQTRTLAYDWLSNKLYDAPSLNSYMSYEDNGWTEPYHWNGILGFGVPRGGGMPASPQALMVSGMYDPVTGSATVTNVVRFDRTTVGAGNLDELWNMQEAVIAGSTLSLNMELLNSADQPVDAVIVPVARPCCALHTDPRPFSAVAPCSTVVRAVRLTATSSSGGTIPQGSIFRASAGTPTVSVTSPAAGASFGSGQSITVNWTSSDSDGDPLTAMVQYSRDGGTTWNVVADVGNVNSYTFAAADRLAGSVSLAGNGSSLFRVIVSDGFNTASGLSPAFKVPNRAPLVQFVSPKNGSIFPASQQILLEALATDPEDIRINSYGWTSLHNGMTTNLGTTSEPRFLISDGLAPGTYTLTCNAIDSTLQAASASITITIGDSFVEPPADSDGDGFPDAIDLCPDVASATNTDSDGDGVGDACDKCPVTFNTNQADRDGDGIGDDCDPCPLGKIVQIGVDGAAEPNYGPALAVQNTATSAGDSSTGDENNSTGSELDNLHAFIDCDTLFLHIGGNLAIGASDSVDIFIDSTSGGQGKLRAGNPAGLAGLSEVSSGMPGLTFETGFSPDYWIGLRNQWRTVNVAAELAGTYCRLTASGANPAQVNLGTALAYGSGLFSGGDANSLGIHATIDNSNTAGVPAGTGGASGGSVVNGIEVSIPLSSIGSPACDIKVFVLLRDTTQAGADTLTNQTLPGIGGGAALGVARNVNFNSVPGVQQATIVRPVVGPAAADLQPSQFGKKFTVSAAVYAPAPYTIQWRRDGVPISDSFRISGSGTEELTIDPARTRDLGTYTAQVTAACGTFENTGAVLNFCTADFNESGIVSVQDIFDFLAAYFDADLHADFNGSGGLSVQDIFEFLAAYFAGCA